MCHISIILYYTLCDNTIINNLNYLKNILSSTYGLDTLEMHVIRSSCVVDTFLENMIFLSIKEIYVRQIFL